METQRHTRSKVIGLLEGTVLGAFVIGAVVVGTSIDRPSERAARAWTDRLEAQAEAYTQARIMQAWTNRLDAVARQQANDAWTARLDAAARASGINQRANDAWTERLNGLAEHLGGE